MICSRKTWVKRAFGVAGWPAKGIRGIRNQTSGQLMVSNLLPIIKALYFGCDVIYGNFLNFGVYKRRDGRSKTVFFVPIVVMNRLNGRGRCIACGEWNTYIEEKISKAKTPSIVSRSKEKKRRNPLRCRASLQDTPIGLTPAMVSSTACWEGLVYGSIVLVGGQPGMTNLPSCCNWPMHAGGTVLYVSGEESAEQIRCGPIDWVRARDGVLFIQRHHHRPS